MRSPMLQSAIALIDGEHYPQVNRASLDALKERFDLKACVFVGGTEKVDQVDMLPDQLQTKVYFKSGIKKGVIPMDLIDEALSEIAPETVIDLSDEPIVNYHSRFQIACRLMEHNVEYIGSDFHFCPPDLPRLLKKPSLAVSGTAKRIGKTAMAGYIARLIDRQKGLHPAIVTMGRGGPETPEIIRGRELVFSPELLVEESLKGKHACSDHWEDAYTSKVTTIGCRRCAGGMAGQVFISNVAQGIELANNLEENFVILEGSGATLPPAQTDKHILLIGSHQDLNYIQNYFGPFRVSIADLVIVTLCDDQLISREKVLSIRDSILAIKPDVEIALTNFVPKPLGDLKNKKVFLVTTAPNNIVEKSMIPYLEENYNCQVLGSSPYLSNREFLRRDLKGIDEVDVVLTEIKAAAVDVVAKTALNMGKEVCFMDNEPILVGGGTVQDLDESILKLTKSE